MELTDKAAWEMRPLWAVGVKPGSNMTRMARDADREMRKTLSRYDGQKIEAAMRENVQDQESAARIRKDLDIHSALLFYCAPKIAKKISSFETADGHKLIQEEPDKYIFWQTGEQQQQELQKIFAGIDPETKMQICATYDIKNKDLVLHFGGTDFTNGKDMLEAGISLADDILLPKDSINPRSVKGADYAIKVITEWRKLNPQLSAEEVNLSIVAHSSGGAAVPMAIVALQEEGFKTNAAFILTPCGAEAAFNKVQEITGIAPEVLQQNVQTIQTKSKGILGIFKKATASVGTEEILDTKGHLGICLVRAFNQQKLS
jgi:hypothetical protein